jgi:phosphatidate cytidylyltransferase
MLKTRVLTALVLLAAFLLCLFYLPDAYWGGVLLLALLVGASEWANIAAFSRPGKWAYVAATAAFGAGLFALGTGKLPSAAVFVVSLLFWLGVAPAWLKLKWRVENRGMLAVVGWILLLPTGLALFELRAASPVLLLGLMGVVWVSDIAAYFTGRAFGRRKLAPAISPGKTWEGVFGALAAVALYGWVWQMAGQQLFARLALDGYALMLWGTLALWLLAYFGILGDLFESWMKRQAGMKDSGRILPGHGGVLDRIDALTSTLPLAALALILWHRL